MIILLSGGLDSTVLTAYLLGQLADGADPPETLSVFYGQRHARELDAAAAVARYYELAHEVVDISAVGRLLAGSALTDPARVGLPEGHYTDTTMAATVVPGRNLLMLSAAVAVANARGHGVVAFAAHAGDHPIYPDCRPEFTAAANLASTLGYAVQIDAPFTRMTKAAIAALGAKTGAPMGLTWSCYAGGDVHCGRCGTCVERAEAFALARVPDPTRYADPGYWRQATAQGAARV